VKHWFSQSPFGILGRTVHCFAKARLLIKRGKALDETTKVYQVNRLLVGEPHGHSVNILPMRFTTVNYFRTCTFGGLHMNPLLFWPKSGEILPDNQKSVFSDNGSTAVEVAIKVTAEFFNKGEKRTAVIAFENAFHGDTFAAMAASGISLYPAFEECLLMSFAYHL
jgi:adenosylmethionine-8-amino-7-oxononanoate aminotransferase